MNAKADHGLKKLSSTTSLKRLTSKPAEPAAAADCALDEVQRCTGRTGETAMTRIQIIGAPFSSYVWVVRMACEEKGVPYDLVPARMHSPEVLAIHPFGKIPVMRHDDITLCESKAIATYIDRTFAGPKLIPDDAREAAEVEQWVSLVNTAIDPCLIRTYIFGYLFPKGADGKPDRAAIGAVLPAMQTQIDVLDKAVARTGYLVGDSFSLADIYLMPVLEVVQRAPEGSEMAQSAKKLAAYFARHAGRPSYRASFPPPPPSVRRNG
jgi:glutathione S-transferase